MSKTEMSDAVAREESHGEKEVSPGSSPRDAGEDEKEVSENGKEKDKNKEKSEDKDSKAWQQDGDFAYEYVQLAQVRAVRAKVETSLHVQIHLSSRTRCRCSFLHYPSLSSLHSS